jgi:hypothetical protein
MRSDKELARLATAIEIAAMGTNNPGKTADQLLKREFTRDEMRRAKAYLDSGKSVTGR